MQVSIESCVVTFNAAAESITHLFTAPHPKTDLPMFNLQRVDFFLPNFTRHGANNRGHSFPFKETREREERLIYIRRTRYKRGRTIKTYATARSICVHTNPLRRAVYKAVVVAVVKRRTVDNRRREGRMRLWKVRLSLMVDGGR